MKKEYKIMRQGFFMGMGWSMGVVLIYLQYYLHFGFDWSLLLFIVILPVGGWLITLPVNKDI